jgi:hypothetical protein
MAGTRFPIRFDRWYRWLSSACLLPPSAAYLEVEQREIVVHMGWAFHARFPVAAVRRTAALGKRPLSRGVHGFAGRWLVNGSGDGILVLDLDPPQRAVVAGFPIRLTQLLVSVLDPSALALELESRRHP